MEDFLLNRVYYIHIRNIYLAVPSIHDKLEND